MDRPPAESASPPSLPSGKPFDGGTEHTPRLLEKTSEGERVIELTKPSLVLGSDDGADISLGGLFVAGRHAEISKVGDHYVIKHLKGLRKVRVCGKPVIETVLSSNDDIKIANKEFIFIE